MNKYHRMKSESKENIEEDLSFKAYTRRWVILAIVCISCILRGFNQAYSGPVNDVYSKYLNVYPWQIDWLVTSQSVTVLVLLFPISLFATKIGFRNITLIMTVTQAFGYLLTLVGVWFNTWGFFVLILAQVFNGFTNVVSLSIAPTMSAIWFPSNEVPLAVGVVVSSKGIGEALGTFVSTRTILDNLPMGKLHTNIVLIFAAMSLASILSCVISVMVVRNAPTTAPSLAQKRIQISTIEGKESDKIKFTEIFRAYRKNVVSLIKDKSVIVVLFSIASTFPLLRTLNILLSSILHDTFSENLSHIDLVTGNTLTIAWVLYTVFSLVSGPCIRRYGKYKEFSVFSVAVTFFAYLIAMLGLILKNEITVLASVIVLSVGVGMVYVALYELLAEVSYPVPMMFASFVSLYGRTFARMVYPIALRYSLDNISGAFSLLLPIFLSFASTCLLALFKPIYRRSQMNEGEKIQLVKK